MRRSKFLRVFCWAIIALSNKGQGTMSLAEVRSGALRKGSRNESKHDLRFLYAFGVDTYGM